MNPELFQCIRFRWQQHRLRRVLAHGMPVIVYQMGKVGSMAVVRGLQASGVRPVFHAHRLHPSRIRDVHEDIAAKNLTAAMERRHERDKALQLYREVIARQRPASFITLVREPIGRNVSAFFQNLDVYFPEGIPADNMQALRAGFLERYPHNVPLTWFEEELATTLSIDVYAEPFPWEKGALRITREPFDLLLLKSELPDTQKTRHIADFLGLDTFTLERENVGAVKGYGALYQQFKASLALPASYVDRMAGARYTRHFYNENEIHAMITRWSTPAASTLSDRKA